MLSTMIYGKPLDDTDPADMKVSSVGWLAKDMPEYKLVVPHQQCSQVRGAAHWSGSTAG